MTFREQYRADMERVVPSEDFESRLMDAMQRQAAASEDDHTRTAVSNPVRTSRTARRAEKIASPLCVGFLGETGGRRETGSSAAGRSVRKWKTAAIVLAAACFVLLLGVGATGALLLRGNFDMNNAVVESSAAIAKEAEYDALTMGTTEEAAPEEDGYECYSEEAQESACDEASGEYSDSAKPEANLAETAEDGSGEESGVWLDGMYVYTANDLLCLYADRSEVSALARPDENGDSVPLALDAQTISNFADCLYDSSVGVLYDGIVYDSEHEEGWDWSTVSDTENTDLLLCFSDGSSLRLTVYTAGYVRIGALSFVLIPDPSFSSILKQ